MTVDMYPTLRALRVAKGMTQVELAQSFLKLSKNPIVRPSFLYFQ